MSAKCINIMCLSSIAKIGHNLVLLTFNFATFSVGTFDHMNFEAEDDL